MLRLAVWLCVLALLTGCAGPSSSPPTVSPPAPMTVTPARLPTPTSIDVSGRRLVIWLPPQFAPEARLPGGAVLAEQLAEFEAAHPGWTVQVRLKTLAGPSGLLGSLLAAYDTAPAALPDLVALTADDLAAAAQADALVPLDGWARREVYNDSYPFAQTMSRVQGQWLGAPFAADARLLVYNTDLYPVAPVRWSEIVTGTLVVPGAEAAALTVLNEYLALGGTLIDEAGRVALEAGRLALALSAWQANQRAGVLPLSTLDYTGPDETWQVFRERRATLAVTTAQWYLAEADRVSTAGAALPPNSIGQPFTLADGWCWALVDKGDDYTPAAELLDWLTDPARLTPWTLAAQVLPTRAAVLAGWKDAPAAPLAAAVATRAQLLPADQTLEQVGPVLRQALDDVLRSRATPNAAAERAAQELEDLQE